MQLRFRRHRNPDTIASDTTCGIAWTTGSTTSQGIRMRMGLIVAAACVMGEGARLVICDVTESGVLIGTWTVAGQPGLGTEGLSPR